VCAAVLCHKRKGKVRPVTGHEGPEGRSWYSSTDHLTSVLDGTGWSTPGPATLPPIESVRSVQKAGWAPGPIWTGAENLPATGSRSPDRPACSASLFRRRYRGPLCIEVLCIIRLKTWTGDRRSAEKEMQISLSEQRFTFPFWILTLSFAALERLAMFPHLRLS